MAALTVPGNTKLGRAVYHTDLPAGPSCPGASDYCAVVCYAKRGRYGAQASRYGSNLERLREDPEGYAAQLVEEISHRPIGAAFRFHTSGDIDSVRHVDVIRAVCESRPDMRFYLYTRSWRVPEIRRAITRGLFPLHNVTVWASTDPTTGPAPKGWRDAAIVANADTARADRRPVCPEQTGKRASCADCGLCWNAKPSARLAFIEH